MRDFIKRHEAILKNISWLYLMQIANYLFPLITLPYLLRVVGLDKYGIIVLGQAVMGYTNTIVEYGFNLTATREIANLRRDFTKIQPIYNYVMQTKIGITLLIALIGVIVLFLIPFTAEEKLFWVMAFTIVLGQLMNPVFFFQGIEDMKYITFVNLITRSLYLVLLFLVVREESDFIYAVLLQGVSAMVAGAFALRVAYTKYGVYVSSRVRWSQIKEELRKGWPIYIANCCGNIYSQGSAVIVNLLAGNVATSYFSLATKVSGVVCQIFQPGVQAIYPRVCQKFSEHDGDRIMHVMVKYTAVLSLLGCVATSLAAPLISLILKGDVDAVLVRDIHIANVMLFFTIMNVAMHPFVLATGAFNFVQKLYMMVSGGYLVVASLGTIYFQQEGMLCALIAVEVTITSNYFYQLFRRKTVKEAAAFEKER